MTLTVESPKPAYDPESRTLAAPGRMDAAAKAGMDPLIHNYLTGAFADGNKVPCTVFVEKSNALHFFIIVWTRIWVE